MAKLGIAESSDILEVSGKKGILNVSDLCLGTLLGKDHRFHSWNPVLSVHVLLEGNSPKMKFVFTEARKDGDCCSSTRENVAIDTIWLNDSVVRTL